MRVTVLGAGNTGLSLAASLALDGHEVMLWEHQHFETAIEPLRSSPMIDLELDGRVVKSTIAGVTSDAAEALAWSDDLLMSVPSYAHAPILDAIGPHVRSAHLLALLPGNLGTLAVVEWMRRASAPTEFLLAESDTAPYVCRKLGSQRAVIWGEVSNLGLGVRPVARKVEGVSRLRAYFPAMREYPHVLAAGLSALNPVVHPPGVLLNSGRIERSRGEFWFYEEGVTASVVAAIERLDSERLALGAALGLALTPVAEAFHRAGFGPAGDLWSVINGSRMLTSLRAPGAIETRWLTEDVPYGLATWAALAGQLAVPTPTMDAFVTVAEAVLNRDFTAESRTPADLGLAGLASSEMVGQATG